METFRATFERTWFASDCKQNISFPVQVPPGTTQLNIRLAFSPWKVDNINNMLTLSVFDPLGFRGAGHRHGDVHEVVLDSADATPGYFAGPIYAGEWRVVVDTHMIYSESCSIRLDVWGTDEAIKGAPKEWVVGQTRARGPGWYRGDLHAHTIHSDARWDVPALLAWARARKLDFCTLSDHNTVSPLAQMDAARSDDLLTLGGMELTTFWGHALALGGREWVDWRTGNGRTMSQIAAHVMERGATFIIGHPKSIGDPYCTGCRWVHADMQPGTARVVEAWNGAWSGEGGKNEDALVLIYQWLNRGYRLALTAGTDNHGSDSAHYGFNVVYADELSEQEILRAVRAGHSYLSSGPRLMLHVASGDQRAMMGDVVNAARGAPIMIQAEWDESADESELSLIVDGTPHESVQVGPNGSHAWQLVAGQANWCLLTLRAPDRRMLALTNPIYFVGE